jgi:hypothetical protein
MGAASIYRIDIPSNKAVDRVSKTESSNSVLDCRICALPIRRWRAIHHLQVRADGALTARVTITT